MTAAGDRTPIVRPAAPGDVDTLFELIVALADYERLRDQVRGSPELLGDALFGPRRHAEAVLAELGAAPAGFALYFHTFSTFHCRPGLWLEDLFVVPEHRGSGIGRLLMGHLARVAVERGCARLEWAALDWNEPALRFYAALGARTLDDWRTLRLDGAALQSLSRRSSP
jgi:GNAT superfamily N-acetyltransferase